MRYNTISTLLGIQPHTTKPQAQHCADQKEHFYDINTNPDTLNVTQTVAAQIPEQT